MKKRMHPLFILGLLLCVASLTLIGAGAASVIGHMAGAADAARARERLDLLWPSLMTMHQDDRALLVGLAMSCHLERRPAAANEVVACLREAAVNSHAMLPKDMDPARARARLEQLLPHSGDESA